MAGFVQILTFFLILLVGYVYVWRKGVLDWGPVARRARGRPATGRPREHGVRRPTITASTPSCRC